MKRALFFPLTVIAISILFFKGCYGTVPTVNDILKYIDDHFGNYKYLKDGVKDGGLV